MYNKKLVYAAACTGMAFFGIAFIVMGSVLPSLTAKYALNAIGTSSLVTLLPVGVLSGSLIFGPIVDRFGYKNLLIISTIITALGLEGLSCLDNLNLLRSCIFLIGLGGGILNGETNALVADIYDDRERGSKLSFLGVFYGIGALGIPLLLGALSKFCSYEIILRGTGIFMLLCVVCFISIRFPKPAHAQGFPIKKALSLIKDPVLLLLSFVLFFQSGIEGLCNNWTTSFLDSTASMKSGYTVLALSFFILGMILGRLLVGYLLKQVKSAQILAGGIFIALSGSILLHFSSGFIMAASSLLLMGIGITGVFPIFLSFIGTLYKETVGTAMGLVLFIALTGNSLLNYSMGYIVENFGIGSFPLFIIINLIIQAIIMFVCIKNIHSKLKTKELC